MKIGWDSLKKWVAIAAVCCVSIATVGYGQVVCLCADDPDACGESCHDCGKMPPDGIGSAEPCHHIAFGSVNFWLENDCAPTIVSNGSLHGLTIGISRSSAISLLLPVLCATAPPAEHLGTSLYRAHRVLLLS